MTLRKTLIGTGAALLLIAGLSAQAEAQTDPTPTPTVEAEATPTPTVEAATPTPTADVAATPTPTADAAAPTATADPAATPTVDASTTTDDDDTNIGEAFATDTPNPQPSEPLTPTDEAADDAASTDEVLGETQLAFTGPDSRVAALAMVLLGAGASFVAVSRRHGDKADNNKRWVG